MSERKKASKKNRKTFGRYSFANLDNHDYLENLDTSVVDLTQETMRVIQSGDTDMARTFVQSEIFQLFREQLRQLPDYVPVSYSYYCVVAYAFALSELSAYSEAEKLLARLTMNAPTSIQASLEAMGEAVIAFTGLVAREKQAKQGTGPVLRARAFIEDHLYTRFKLEELASYCGCSLSYLRHLFRKETGCSLVAYIQERKIERAKGLLKSNDYTSAEIASQLGFCSESYFIKVFKDTVGCTPGSFRKK